MTRRSFARAIAGAAVVIAHSAQRGNGRSLESLTPRRAGMRFRSSQWRAGGIPIAAMYGAHLPQTLRIPRRIASRHRWFELRTYTGETEKLAGLFARSGIQAHLLGRGWGARRFLFPFPSLEERGRIWDRLNGDPDWSLTRGQVRLTEVTIYRHPRANIKPQRSGYSPLDGGV
jgi:hypothetical protein